MILVDVNIFMDFLEQRERWETSLAIISKVRQKKEKGCISALTIPILYFLRSKYFTDQKARQDVQEITAGFRIISLNQKSITLAFASTFSDFEDALQYSAAIEKKCSAIITRNTKDFLSSKIPVLTPEEYLKKE